jgi:hypothetical protein
VVAAYNRVGNLHTTIEVEPSMRNRGDGRVRILSASISNSAGEPLNSFLIGDDIAFEFSVESLTTEDASFWLIIFDAAGRPLLSSHQRDVEMTPMATGRYRVRLLTRGLGLMPGNYTVSAGAFDQRLTFLDWVDGCQQFEVLPSFQDGVAFDGRWGAMNLKAEWKVLPRG